MEDNPFSVGSLIDETDEEAEPLLQRVKAPEAAVRVRQAWALEESGDELPGGALSQGTRRTFRFAHMIQPVTTLSVLLLFALSFAEPAAGCEPWGCERGKEEMPHSYMWMPWMVLLPLQGILTLPLVMSSVAEAILQQGSRKNKWRLYLVVAKLVNIVLLIAHTGLGMAYRHLEWPPRLGAYLRAMAVLMEVPLAREAARIVLGVLPSFGGVVVGVAAFSFIGGWVSKVALEGSEDVEAAKPFASLTRAAKSSFSLLLGDDTPDLWAGLIEVNHLYALLFVPLIVAGNLWLMPLTLGSIYGAYKAHLSARVKKLGRRRDERLDEAFELLEEQHEGELQLASIEALLEELDQFPSLPSLGEERAKRVFHRLDDDKSMMIDSYEFRRLCSVLRHLYAKAKKDGEIDDNAGALERMWYKPWAPMRWLSAKALDVIVTALLCVNAVTLFLETEVAGSGTLAERCLIFIEAGFTCVYVIEIIIKLCKFSPHAYFYSRYVPHLAGRSRFDVSFRCRWFNAVQAQLLGFRGDIGQLRDATLDVGSQQRRLLGRRPDRASGKACSPGAALPSDSEGEKGYPSSRARSSAGDGPHHRLYGVLGNALPTWCPALWWRRLCLEPQPCRERLLEERLPGVQLQRFPVRHAPPLQPVHCERVVREASH